MGGPGCSMKAGRTTCSTATKAGGREPHRHIRCDLVIGRTSSSATSIARYLVPRRRMPPANSHFMTATAAATATATSNSHSHRQQQGRRLQAGGWRLCVARRSFFFSFWNSSRSVGIWDKMLQRYSLGSTAVPRQESGARSHINWHQHPSLAQTGDHSCLWLLLLLLLLSSLPTNTYLPPLSRTKKKARAKCPRTSQRRGISAPQCDVFNTASLTLAPPPPSGCWLSSGG